MKSYKKDIKKHKKSFRNQRVRTLLLFVFLELCFAFLMYRLFSLQCIRGDELRRQAAAQYRSEICIAAKRGIAYDRNFQPLAININTYSLYADPSILEHSDSMVEFLSSILDMPKSEMLQKLEYKRRFVWLKRQLPDQTADRVRSLGIRGLDFKEEEKRFYPKGNLSAHVIGFVGLDNVGLDGIEKQYDSYMRGSFQELVSQKDRKGRDLIPQEIGYDESTRGDNVLLTIDEVIQHIAEKELQIACKKWRAMSGSVIIMNPQTGEILALANYPTYDLNKAFSTTDDLKRNRATRDLYEPGSVFKIVTAAAAINENLVTMEEQIDCENGLYNFNGFPIHDSEQHDRLTFSEVLEQSSNIGIVKVASRLGDRRLYDYIKAFGLTEKTGVDLSERVGFIRPLERWTKRSMAAIPFGHELAITPLQMLCSTNAIANDGVIMKPFIVRAIMDGHKTLTEFSPQKSRTPISSRTAKIMKEILTRAVENGTGKNAKIHGYKVAGKTGTAQKASGSLGYLPDKYVSSFTGFISAENMVISMIVVINEPQDIYTGSTVACPVFREIATQIIQYMTIGRKSYAAGTKPAS